MGLVNRSPSVNCVVKYNEINILFSLFPSQLTSFLSIIDAEDESTMAAVDPKSRPTAAASLWTDFQSEFCLGHELPMSEAPGWAVAEQPIVVACAACSLPVIAPAFGRHWGIIIARADALNAMQSSSTKDVTAC
jgi:hypothetical protein